MRHLHKEHYHIFFMVVNLSKVFFSSLFLVCSCWKQTDAILVDYESVWLVVSTEQSERCPYLFDIPSAEELVIIWEKIFNSWKNFEEKTTRARVCAYMCMCVSLRASTTLANPTSNISSSVHFTSFPLVRLTRWTAYRIANLHSLTILSNFTVSILACFGDREMRVLPIATNERIFWIWSTRRMRWLSSR